MTVKDALFSGHKLPALDVQVVLSTVLNVDKSILHAHPEFILDSKQQAAWFNALNKLQEGVPVAYVTNHKEFYGYDFYVDNCVLIPRPETEDLVSVGIEFVVERLKSRQTVSILELCTGSGAPIISLVLELHKRGVDVTKQTFIATDISAAAVAIAQRNARFHAVNASIDFRQGNLFEPVFGKQFDLVISNPPYLPSAESHSNKHEPQLALDGGGQGNEMIDQILQQSDRFLKTDGLLVIEGYGGEILKKNYS